MIEGAKNLRDFLLSLSPILYPERSVAESLKPLSSFFQPSGAFSLADLDRLKRTGPARSVVRVLRKTANLQSPALSMIPFGE